ncbi:hypothetical protein GALMADRAFT_224169 [Galerina marginata CBS 339.88]|uniref:ThuA-like domain-containing protein n=1 Tax=Galerina marginata (strain CBS 339.88) TaxID=685588 RepID=A0A067T986_GALM3|nr:hypothetical protein GALMADRAFT_224169 [Galerina marginata CBS 339.88]
MANLVYLLLLHCLSLVVGYAPTISAAGIARILIYSATRGFRHDSIPTAIDALKARGTTIDAEFVSTEDPSQFMDTILSGFDAIVFLSTTGEVLDSAGKTAFQNYLNHGGNFVGIHSASDTLVNTTCYTSELGAVFDYHPELQNFTVDVLGPPHPSTSMLPDAWTVSDEAYNFKSDPRALGSVVVLSADESTYVDTGVRKFDQGKPHPTAWYQEKGAGIQEGGIAGRSFYTSLGHLNETWQDHLFLSHVLGAISWVLQANTTLAFNSTAQVGNQATNSTPPAASTQPSNSQSQSTASSASQMAIAVGTIALALLGQRIAKIIKDL